MIGKASKFRVSKGICAKKMGKQAIVAMMHATSKTRECRTSRYIPCPKIHVRLQSIKGFIALLEGNLGEMGALMRKAHPNDKILYGRHV